MLEALVLSFLLGSAFDEPATAQEEPSTLIQAMKGATACTLAAGKDGVDRARFDDDDSWQRQEDGSYSSAGLPISVTFPADADGVSRICVVDATLPSQEQQKEMQAALEVLLRQKPVRQRESIVWMFGSPPNARGLQFFPDQKSEKPQVRFIGAAF